MPPKRFGKLGKGKGGKASSSASSAAAPIPLPTTPEQLESVLSALMAPDTNAIRQAETIMNAFLKQPSAVPAMLQQLTQSSQAPARQMSAVLLRRAMNRLWRGLNQEQRQHTKTLLLQQLFSEPNRLVRHSIGALISSLASQLVPKKQWPELLDALLSMCSHQSESHRQVAMKLFCALAENLTKSLQPHFKTLLAIFTRGLSDPTVSVRIEALKALSALVYMLDEDSEDEFVASFSGVIEPLLQVMSHHASDADVLMAGFEVLDNLAGTPVQVLDPFIPGITELMCRLVTNSSAEYGTRTKAGELLEDIIKHKVHRLLKPVNLIPNLFKVSYKLLTEIFEDEEEMITPQLLAVGILDAILLNLHIPKKDTYPLLLNKADGFLQSSRDEDRKAGFIILAVMAEGCNQLIVDRLAQLVPVACAGLRYHPPHGAPNTESAVKVRINAAIAIEEFADKLHPDISAYHSTILPVLMDALTNPNEHDMVKEKACGALDVFVQHLDEHIGQYVQAIVPQLLSLVSSKLSHVSQSAISALGAVALAAKKDFEPYLNASMEALGPFLMATDEESLGQRCRATGTVGKLGLAVGKERFCQPFAPEPGQNFYDLSFHLVVKGFALEYFELRENAYMCFADWAEMMGEEFAPRLSVVMPLAIATLFTDDGVVFKNGASEFNNQDEDDEDDEEDGEMDGGYPSDSDSDVDDERKHRFVIRSGALDEKCATLHCVTTLLPIIKTEDMRRFVQASGGRDIVTAAWELSEYPHPFIRAANVQMTRELILWFHRACPPPRKWSQGESVPFATETLKKQVHRLVMLLLERLDDDDDRQTAAEAADALGEALQTWGLTILDQPWNHAADFDDDDEEDLAKAAAAAKNGTNLPRTSALEHLFKLLLRFINEKAPCQLLMDEESEEASGVEEIQDHDFVLMESVSDLIAILPQVMGPMFEPAWRKLFPAMQRFLRPDKQAPTKGMAIGCFAEVLHWLTPLPPASTSAAPPTQQQLAAMAESHVLAPYFPQFLQFALAALADPSPLVRRNGSFCSGCLIAIPHPIILQAYPQLLQGLRGVYMPHNGPVDPVAGVEKGSVANEEFLAARDNATSAICRILATAPQASGASFQQLLEIVLDGLPLQCDFDESKHAYPILMNLYRTHPNEIAPYTGRVITIMSAVFGNPDVDTAIQRDIIAFCKALTQQAPQEMEKIFATLTPHLQGQFKKFILDQMNVPAA